MFCVLAAWLGPAAAGHARPFFVLRPSADVWLIVDPTAREAGAASGIQKMWVVTVQRNITTGEPAQAGYVRSLNEYDCEGDRVRWRSFDAFLRDGSPVLSRKNESEDWEAATTNPARLVELRIACGRSSGDSVVEAESVAKLVIAVIRTWDPPVTAAPPKASVATPAPGAARKAVASPLR